MPNDYLRPDPSLKKLKTDKPTFAILLGPHYQNGWYRSEVPLENYAHQCGHCRSMWATLYPLDKQVYVPSEVEGEAGFYATKHCAIVHCEKCGGEVEIEYKPQKLPKHKEVTATTEAVKQFKQLTPEQQAKLMELIK